MLINVMRRESLTISYIKNSVKKGFSPIVLFVGKQRMGKTATALTMACSIINDFDPKTFLTNDVMKFGKIYDDYEKKLIIFDEAGTTLDPVEHASLSQRVFNHIIESQAYKNHILFLCVPFSSEIAKKHHKHINVVVWVNRRGGYKSYSCTSWYPDFSFKPPRLMLIESVGNVPLPPPSVWEYYKGEGQKVYKESILSMEMLRLEKQRTNSGTTQRKYAKFPTPTPIVVQQ